LLIRSYSDRCLEDTSLDRPERLLRRGVGDEPALADDRETRAKLGDILDDVCREQDNSLLRQLGKQSIESLALLRIKASGGLVHDDQPGIAGDGLRDSQALPHASRVGHDLAARREAEVHLLQQLVAEPIQAARCGHSLEPQKVPEHRCSGQVREEAEVPRQVSQPAPTTRAMWPRHSRRLGPSERNPLGLSCPFLFEDSSRKI